MQPFRHLIERRAFVALVCASALLLKLIVPTGYMIGNECGRIVVTICSGTGPTTMTIDLPGMHGDAGDMGGHGRPDDAGKAEMPCAFAGLSAAVLEPTDPIQVAALIAFVLAIGLAATRAPVPTRPAYLRPPLRGPPTYL